MHPKEQINGPCITNNLCTKFEHNLTKNSQVMVLAKYLEMKKLVAKNGIHATVSSTCFQIDVYNPFPYDISCFKKLGHPSRHLGHPNVHM